MTEAANDESVDALFDAVVDGANQWLVAPGGPVDDEPAPEISYEEFGSSYVRGVLHKDRVLAMVNDVLGPTIQLGPIGAGPGRKAATVNVVGTFGTTTGEEIAGELLAYRVFLPINVEFDIDMRVDRHVFVADVVVPLTLTVHTVAPLRIRIDIAVPSEDAVELKLQASSRRGAAEAGGPRS